VFKKSASVNVVEAVKDRAHIVELLHDFQKAEDSNSYPNLVERVKMNLWGLLIPSGEQYYIQYMSENKQYH
jgi:hypothetical protein